MITRLGFSHISSINIYPIQRVLVHLRNYIYILNRVIRLIFIGYEGDGFVCTDVNECFIDNGGCSTNPRVQCLNTRVRKKLLLKTDTRRRVVVYSLGIGVIVLCLNVTE